MDCNEDRRIIYVSHQIADTSTGEAIKARRTEYHQTTEHEMGNATHWVLVIIQAEDEGITPENEGVIAAMRDAFFPVSGWNAG